MADPREGSTVQPSGSDEHRAKSDPDSVRVSGAEAGTTSLPLSPTAPPVMIGGYRIIRELGAGGMGIVYEAEQQRPKRFVALKVVKGGRFVDDQQIRLFERETQALARLKHPGIAAIYESGRTSEGQHFFAMELVRGETLKEYLEKASSKGPLTPPQFRERLAIFRKIADAVTYAHQRGVIHRDLKPSNIIVLREFESSNLESMPDAPGIKVLDFGLARITETDLAVSTIGTEIGAIQGTLPYMSPEQVRGNPDEIDVRSDVYSLGVILYEMLAGKRPYNVQNAMLHEAVRMICETPATPLSRSWSGTKKLDRDIETIVEKALEKSVARRYQSVGTLGEDISRFLAGQPILARPPSTLYQIRKMVVRHKIGFAFAASLLVLIAAFSIGMSIQARRIAKERDRANREARVSQKVSDFLVSLFQVSDPYEGRGKDITAREILDFGSNRIATELQDEPEIRAALFDTTGAVYGNLGLYDKAIDLAQSGLVIREKRLGRDSLESAKSLQNLGNLKMKKADYTSAEALMREALDIRKKKLGADSPAVAESYCSISELEFEKGNWKRSEELLRQAIAIQGKALGEESLEVANTLNGLAVVLRSEGRLSECEPLHQRALSIRRKLLGPTHPYVSQSINNLAMLYLRTENYPEAEKLFTEALSINRKTLGNDSAEVSANLNNLALLKLDLNRLQESENLFREAVAIDQKTNNSLLGNRMQNLGVVLTHEKKYPEAEECLRKAVGLKLLTFKEDHWEVATARNLLGACLAEMKRFREAEPLLVQSYTIIKSQFGPKNERTRRAASRLENLYNSIGKKDKAAAIVAELGSQVIED